MSRLMSIILLDGITSVEKFNVSISHSSFLEQTFCSPRQANRVKKESETNHIYRLFRFSSRKTQQESHEIQHFQFHVVSRGGNLMGNCLFDAVCLNIAAPDSAVVAVQPQRHFYHVAAQFANLFQLKPGDD
ncbi:MAG: hypothetical protein FD188_3153 [Ignavibacteria bacterium]|nr:MAG: hypothetical protein FD188_3153 [Ignavibacteria bacterium]